MPYQLFQLPKQLHLGSSFTLPAGAKAYFYATTTTTPQDTFTTSALDVAHANPVVADAAGLFPAIYLDPTLQYKLTLNTSADVLIYTVDPVNDQLLSQSIIAQLLYPQTAAEIAASVTPTDYAYQPGNVKRYGAVGDGVTNDAPAFQEAIDLAKFSGETVIIPAPQDGGAYLLTSALNCTITVADTGAIVNSRGFTIRCEGNQLAISTSAGVRPVILAKHTGHVFDCTGSYGINFENLSVGTDDSTYPKTCFFFARNSTASSSNFRVSKCRVFGKFSESVVYNYGAEEDQYDGCQFSNREGGANAKVLTFTGYNYRNLSSTFSTIATGAQSTIGHWVFGGTFINFSHHANADIVYLEGSVHLARFFGGHYIGADTTGGGRSFFYMDTTNNVCNDLLLLGVGGEASISQPTYGLYIGDTAGTVSFLSVVDCRLPNGTNSIKSHANVTVSGARFFGITNASLGGGINIAGTLISSDHDNVSGGLTAATYKLNNVIGRQGSAEQIIADNSAAAGKKYWAQRNIAGQFVLVALGDDGVTNLGNAIIATSSGAAVSNLALAAQTFSILVAGLPNFANDAAAAGGGVPVGDIYRNGSVLMVRVA